MIMDENVDLIIYGTGDLDAEIQSLIRELNLSERVLFKGWIDPNDIPTLLGKAHVGVNLLDPSSQSYYFSLANKYFDYIHAGLPILTMDFPEYQRLNSEHQTSILISSLKEDAITEAILELKNNTNLRVGMENIFDIHYREFASGISSSGRNIVLGFNTNF